MCISYKNNIELINKICFDVAPYPNKKVDAIFVFGALGGVNAMIGTLHSLLDNKLSDKLIISGGINTRRKVDRVINGYNIFTTSEARIISSIFDDEKHSNVSVILEENSTNTKENIENSLEYLSDIKSLCFVCKSHHAGRSFRTLKKYLPDVELFQASYNSVGKSSENIITEEDWVNSDDTVKEVLGEIKRIYEYGRKGDISFSGEDEAFFNLLGF